MSNALMTMGNLRELRANLEKFRNSTPRSTGQMGYMKFSKGDWTFGKDDMPVHPKSLWVAHPQSLQHGWICWRDGKLFKEVLVPFTQTLPLETSLPTAPEPDPDSDDAPGYQHQMAVTFACIEGAHEGAQLLYKTSTMGGRQAMDRLTDELFARMDDVEASGGVGGLFPVVRFAKDSYKHKTRGKIWTPDIILSGWHTGEPGAAIEPLDDDEEEEEVEEVAPPPKPARRRVALAT